ncbi:MAG: ATP phosphoribosyltransferase [Fimbriimonadales bacterium]
MNPQPNSNVRIGLPKGRMQQNVIALLAGAGITLRHGAREYRPALSLDGFEVKILKPQNIIEMLAAGSRDIGFAGADWVAELQADLVELLDTGMDSVRLVAAAPDSLLEDGRLPRRPLVIASEYRRLTSEWIERRGCGDSFVRSYGATEVFPPEDADAITDITSTGSTLAANGLAIADELLTSSTRLFASPTAMDDPAKRDRIESLVLLLRSVLDARGRVMVEMNVAIEKMDALVGMLPCMREPTVAALHHNAGYAVKVAVPRRQLPTLIPAIKAVGGTDIVVTELAQIVP